MRYFAAAITLAACTTTQAPSGEVVVPACANEQLAVNSSYVVWYDTCSDAVESVQKNDRSATISVVAGGDGGVSSVVTIDDDYAYFSESNNLVRAPLAGGAVTVLATAQDYLFTQFPNQLAVDDANLYWSQQSLLSVPKDGSGPAQTLAASDLGAHVTTDADYVYWSRVESIHRHAKAGGSDEVLMTNGNLDSIDLMPVAVTSSSVFYLDDGAFALPTSGGAPAMVDSDGTGIAIAADSDYAYWAQPDQIVRGDASGNVTAIASAVGVLGIAGDDSYVYWDSSGAIYRAPK